MSGGYPAGARHDSRAPYNDTGKLCRYCDKDKIEELVPEDAEDREQIIENMLMNAGLCDCCKDEQAADWLSE